MTRCDLMIGITFIKIATLGSISDAYTYLTNVFFL